MPEPTIEELEKTQESCRQDAIRGLNSMFKIPEGFSSGLIEKIVDSILSAAIMDVTIITKRAQNKNEQNNLKP